MALIVSNNYIEIKTFKKVFMCELYFMEKTIMV